MTVGEKRHLLILLRWMGYVIIVIILANFVFREERLFPNSVVIAFIFLLTVFLLWLDRKEKAMLQSGAWSDREKPSIGQILAGPLVALVSLILILGILELGTRFLISRGVFPEIPRLEQLENRDWYYNSSPFPDFHQRSAPYQFLAVPGKAYWYAKNQQSYYVNVFNYRRVTVGQPEHAEKNIYFLGGSTLFSLEVSDAYTIPSYLQDLLNQKYGARYRVVNMGTPGYTAQTQLARLKELEFLDGDIVIFYDGANNAILDSSLSPARFMFPITITMDQDLSEAEVARKQFVAQINAKVINVLHALSFHSRFVQYFSMVRWDLVLNPAYDELYFENRSLGAAQRYQEILLRTAQYLEDYEADVTFVHFLQPVVFTLSDPTEREQMLINSYGTDYTYHQCYEHFVNMSESLREQGILAFDLTHVFDSEFREGNQEIFFDYCHVNHYANEIVAEQIFLRLTPILDQQLSASSE